MLDKRHVVGVLAISTTSLGTTAAFAADGHNSDSVSEQRAERRYTDAHRNEARIGQAEAERLGRAARTGALVESHLETEGHVLRWEVKTGDGKHQWEVQLDPSTGSVTTNQSQQ